MLNAVPPFNKFWNTKYYENESKFNSAYSKSNLPKIKDGAYIINLDEYIPIETHWIALHINGYNGRASYDATYFHNFAVEHIPKKIKKYIASKNIITNIYRNKHTIH